MSRKFWCYLQKLEDQVLELEITNNIPTREYNASLCRNDCYRINMLEERVRVLEEIQNE